MIGIAVHVVVRPEGHVHGPGDTLRDYLTRQNIPFLIIYHPLTGSAPTRVICRDKSGQESQWSIGNSSIWPLPFQAIREAWWTSRAIGNRRLSLFIGIDPVNAWAGAILKRTGRCKKLVFYTADYAHDRFSGSFLNTLYHFADRMAVRWADEVWNVSTRIVEYRRRQGVPEKKLHLVPNAPALQAIPAVPEKPVHRRHIISMATTRDTLENRLVIEAVANLQKEVDGVRLSILGARDPDQQLTKTAASCGAGSIVEVVGLLPQTEVLHRLTQGAIGVALYTKTQPWTTFGDAKKVREYMACGLPVVMTRVPSTADEVEQAGAGILVELNKESLTGALRQLLLDDADYFRRRQAALALARQSDIDAVLDQLLVHEKHNS